MDRDLVHAEHAFQERDAAIDAFLIDAVRQPAADMGFDRNARGLQPLGGACHVLDGDQRVQIAMEQRNRWVLPMNLMILSPITAI